MRTRCRRSASPGVALVSVLLAMVMVTIVVVAVVIAAMGETALAFDQWRGQQAMAVAEAGAYRALAELRRRLSVDLDAQVGQPTTTATDVRHICRSMEAAPPDPTREIVEIITNYAYPVTLAASDWTRTGGTGILRLGTTVSPIQMVGAGSGAAVGEFHATIYIRWSGAPATCVYEAQPEQETMRFDYAVVAAGRLGTAVRTVCLRSPFADTCADWLPSGPPAGWAGSHVLTAGAQQGWPVVITVAPTGGPSPGLPRRDVYTAVRWPTPAPAFLNGDPLYERPHWEELVGQ